MGKTELIKGSTEMILLSLLQDKAMYGYELAQTIERMSEGFLRFREGTLYPALKKLEMQGLVESYWQDSAEGPRRKYYAITITGKKALADMRNEWGVFQRIIHRITGVPNGESQGV
jgi:DNA-binding PadR family transcriptional regulator